MATGVCSLRGRDACMRFMRFMRFMRGVWGRLVIPRGFALPLSVLARAQSYRWVMQCADLPLGNAWQLDGNGGMRVAAA